APQVGNRFPIIFSDGSPISGMFADLPTGSTIPFNGVELDITFVRGNVTLTAIAILPLDLLSFTGEARNKTNLLTWTTANAEDFSHFVVQRSPDGRGPWSVLAQPDLQASGEHEYIDELPLPSAYYRLKMIDLDGTFSYSEVIFLEHFSGEDAGAMQVYPNPSTGRFSVDFTKVNLPSGREGELCLVDLHGRQIWARKISGDQPTLPVALSQPGGGVYLLTLVTDDGRAFKQRVVIR
ncbi:MAG: T9SS type A sorting domain-containing protein, partial [Bacteroidota bacterium]